MPAMSVLGTVGCLPGRTIAFRTAIVRQVMPEFLNQRFLGFVLEVSDDRTLTSLDTQGRVQNRLPGHVAGIHRRADQTA